MSEINIGERIINDIDMLLKKDGNASLKSTDFMQVWTDIVLLPIMRIETLINESNHTKVGYDRNQAVIYGLLLRVYKILCIERRLTCVGLLNHQLASTFSRIILEDNVNIQYYIRHSDKIDDFCKFSVKAELEFADLIDKRRSERNENAEEWDATQLQWEKGLMDSVMQGLQEAGVRRGDKIPGIPDMRTKIKEVGMEEFYISYRLKCHSVHGDWFDICRYNMKKEEEKYYPQFTIQGTDVREINLIIIVVYKTIREFIAMYEGHGIPETAIDEFANDEQLIRNFDDMFFNFRHGKPIISGLEDQVEIMPMQ